jgi:hypothetical protein
MIIYLVGLPIIRDNSISYSSSVETYLRVPDRFISLMEYCRSRELRH